VRASRFSFLALKWPISPIDRFIIESPKDRLFSLPPSSSSSFSMVSIEGSRDRGQEIKGKNRKQMKSGNGARGNGAEMARAWSGCGGFDRFLITLQMHLYIIIIII
jgi:hypothetical protein